MDVELKYIYEHRTPGVYGTAVGRMWCVMIILNGLTQGVGTRARYAGKNATADC